jgi:hypothetical protein
LTLARDARGTPLLLAIRGLSGVDDLVFEGLPGFEGGKILIGVKTFVSRVAIAAAIVVAAGIG